MATISFPEGTTFRYGFTILDKTTGLPIDLTGATLTWAAYAQDQPKTGTPVAYLTKTIGSGITVTDEDAGEAQIIFSPAETVDDAGKYDWELELIEANGDVWLVEQGILLIQPARRLDG